MSEFDEYFGVFNNENIQDIPLPSIPKLPPPPYLSQLVSTEIEFLTSEIELLNNRKKYEKIIDYLKNNRTTNGLDQTKIEIINLMNRINWYMDNYIIPTKDVIAMMKLKNILTATLDYAEILLGTVYDNGKSDIILFIDGNLCIEQKKRKRNENSRGNDRTRHLRVAVITNHIAGASIKSFFEYNIKLYIKAFVVENGKNQRKEICQREIKHNQTNDCWDEYTADFSDIEFTEGTKKKYQKSNGKVRIRFIAEFSVFNYQTSKWEERCVQIDTDPFVILTNESQYQQTFNDYINYNVVRIGHNANQIRIINFYHQYFLESIDNEKMRPLTEMELVYLMNDGSVFLDRDKNNNSCFNEIICNFRFRRSKIFDIFGDGYIGIISKDNAAAILTDKPVGTFILRFSEFFAKEHYQCRIAAAVVNQENQIQHRLLASSFTTQTSLVENEKATKRRKIDVQDSFNHAFKNFIGDASFIAITQIYQNATTITKSEFLEKIFQFSERKIANCPPIYVVC